MPRPLWTLAKHFARIVTGPNDQDVAMLLVGHKGSGKSGSSLSLGASIAFEIAKIRGGEWTDYFNLSHIAIIDPQAANDLMEGMRENGVYIFDDIGLGWNARKYSSQENIQKNDVFQVNRTDRCVQIFSVPNQFLLDKVPRSLVSHLAVMDRNNPQQYFRHGMAIMRVYEPDTLFHVGKIIYPFISANQEKFVSYDISSPPPWMLKQYKALRKEAKQRVIERNKQLREEEEVARKAKIERANRPSENAFKAAEVKRLVAQQGISIREACKRVGMNSNTYYSTYA